MDVRLPLPFHYTRRSGAGEKRISGVVFGIFRPIDE
jgi:hypothetical protein